MLRKRLRIVLVALLTVSATVFVFGRIFYDVSDVRRTLSRHLPILYAGGSLDDDLAALKDDSRQKIPVSRYRTSRSFPEEELATSMPPGYNYTVTVVTGRTSGEETNWLDNELSNLQHVVYVVDDINAEYHTPKNKGNEAMIYLSYLVENYDSLPDISIFVHSSRWAWHNNDIFSSDIAEAIQHLRYDTVTRKGYVNLRCQWHPGCPAWIHTDAFEKDVLKMEEGLIADAWNNLFPGESLPDVLAQPCCSQFALSKARIQAVPKQEYERLRQWLLDTPMADNLVGRIFEYIWQVLFTGRSVLCPSQRACHCEVFGVCFTSEDDFQAWFELRYYLKRDQTEWEEWHDQMNKVNELSKEGYKGKVKAKELEMPPVGRLAELKVAVNGRWMQLLDRKWEAIERGKRMMMGAGAGELR
jgi:hypothetical protein